MNDVLAFAALFALGSALGVTYFGTLWLTVRQLPRLKHPWFVFFGSLLARLGLAIACFFTVLVWYKLLGLAAALAGFLLARLVAVRILSRSGPEKAA